MARNPYYVKTCAVHNGRGCAYSLQKKGTLPLPPVDVCVGGCHSKFFRNPLEDLT